MALPDMLARIRAEEETLDRLIDRRNTLCAVTARSRDDVQVQMATLDDLVRQIRDTDLRLTFAHKLLALLDIPSTSPAVQNPQPQPQPQPQQRESNATTTIAA